MAGNEYKTQLLSSLIIGSISGSNCFSSSASWYVILMEGVYFVWLLNVLNNHITKFVIMVYSFIFS